MNKMNEQRRQWPTKELIESAKSMGGHAIKMYDSGVECVDYYDSTAILTRALNDAEHALVASEARVAELSGDREQLTRRCRELEAENEKMRRALLP